MTTEPAWDYYRTFLSVLRNGSLSAAARELDLTQPTVGRQIAALEKSLGGRALFTRSPSGLLPTRTAHDLQPHAETMASAASVMLRASAGSNLMKGTVRITASVAIGTEVLPAALRSRVAMHGADAESARGERARRGAADAAGHADDERRAFHVLLQPWFERRQYRRAIHPTELREHLYPLYIFV